MNQQGGKEISLSTEQECALQVGQRFFQARQSLGLTIKVMAELLGTTSLKNRFEISNNPPPSCLLLKNYI
ncbi:MAG: hypothetical protein QG657_494 [Acidobacteriota bacterium]|nr:hypothetical protein [Acidobacteriota bacterium]